VRDRGDQLCCQRCNNNSSMRLGRCVGKRRNKSFRKAYGSSSLSLADWIKLMAAAAR